MEIIEDPWSVREEYFPEDGAPGEQLKFLLNYAVLAPTVSNAQPWLFRPAGEAVEMYADQTRVHGNGNGKGRQTVLGCGASLFNLRVAVSHFGFEPVVKIFPHVDTPHLLASVRLGSKRSASAEESKLFALLRKRETYGSAFESKRIPRQVIELMQEAVEADGAAVSDIDESELHWLKSFQAEDQREAGAPTLLVLSTRADNPFEWLVTGQALAHLLLIARGHGIRADFWKESTDDESLRCRLASLIGRNRCPQVALRIGYSRGRRPVPRRPVHDVLASF